jgi:outer membrane protein TolC
MMFQLSGRIESGRGPRKPSGPDRLRFHFGRPVLANRRRPPTVLAVLALAAAIALPVRADDPAGQAGLGADLRGMLDHARSQSPEIAAMRLEADAAALRVGPAGNWPDPALRVELMNLNNDGRASPLTVLPWRVGETRYTVMQSLPPWGQLALRRDAAAADARQAVARTDAAWVELAARIKTTYAESFRVVANQRLTRELLALALQLEQIAQARYAGGLAAQQDAIRAQLEVTALQSELFAQDAEKQALRARLNGLLARDADAALAEPQALREPPALSTADAVALAERARSRHPAIAAEVARLDAAQKNSDLALTNRRPGILVGISPTQSGSRISSWGLMLELNLPLQQGTRRAQEAEAQAMVAAARSRVQSQTNLLLADLAADLAAFEAARRTEALVSTQWLPQAELSLRSALAAYENGKVDFVTLLDAERQIRVARQELLKTQVEAQLRLADIERIVGEDL